MSKSSYKYHDAKPTWSNGYLWPPLQKFVRSQDWRDRRAFDLGCGNGATSEMLHSEGFAVTGVDLSESGIGVARSSFPGCRFEVGSVYDNLAAEFGTFPLVVSLEVIEGGDHCCTGHAAWIRNDVTAFFRETLAPE